METVKLSEYVMEVTITKPVEFVTTRHERGFIEKQIINIQAQKDAYDALRDAEIAECQAILAAMDVLGIVTKLVEPLK